MNPEKEERKTRLELQIIDKPTEFKPAEFEQDSNNASVSGNSVHEDEMNVIDDFFQEKAFGCLRRRARPRIWAINILLWPYFETVTMLVILTNGVTLGMYDPYDDKCQSERCSTLEVIETIIYSFFLFEMLVKMLAMGLRGPLGYFRDSWNKLDFFIVLASTFEYLYGDGEYLSSIRAARVLRPLRAINKVPSIRILVALLLDTLPMLGNVLAICTLIFVVFGIIGVQLWQGVLRNRCALQLPPNVTNGNLSSYYYNVNEHSLMCSLPGDSGMAHCTSEFIPNYAISRHQTCSQSYRPNATISNTSCINWNMYYTQCEQVGDNPYHGAISFDHAGLAFVAIFQVITLEGWSQIMYFLQDTYSPWVWIYFVALIVIGAYFMTNLCLVVIATQFSETRQRESALIEQANKRARLLKSYSTLSGSFSGDQDQGCYNAILGLLVTAYKDIRKSLRRRFAGTRCCKIEERKKKKRRRKIVKKKSKQSVTSTIHLHHHHHHHFHHHHHICADDHQHCSPACADYSPSILDTAGRSLPAPTILAIENVKSEPKASVPSVGPLAIQSTALLMPDTTVVICRSRPSSTRSLQPTHTVSFISTSVNEKSGFADDVPINAGAATVSSPRDFSTGKSRSAQSNCPKVEQYETGVNPEKYEQFYKTESIHDDEDDDDEESEEEEEEEIPGCLARFRGKLKDLCESDTFKIVIMASILLNTVTMGIEHHGQPQKLTDTLDIFNYIFTAIFAIEFIIKLAAYGLYGYLKDSFNLFDGTIVIISTVEIFADSESGVSVLRTFRLMRIFKLIRFLPSLQKQVTVMVKTLDSVMTFLALLIVFIFTVSILGMHLFGAKVIFNGVPVRHNFDSLLWALMTTFQVLTQEEWNIVMYDAMRATTQWASLYFIILMTLGNYILFNLLVAILVEGFSNDPGTEEDLTLKDDKKSDNNSNELYRKSAYEKDAYHDDYTKCDARCPMHRSLIKSMSNTGQASCQHQMPFDVKTKGNSWPNLLSKCRDETCDYKRDMPVRCDSDNTLKGASPRRRLEGRPLLQTTEDSFAVNIDKDEENETKSENSIPKTRRFSAWFTKLFCNCCETRKEYALYVFSPSNRFRVFNSSLIANKWFDRIILFFIFFNCIVLAMESPGLDPNSVERKFIDTTNNIFTGVFILEMLIKVFAKGFAIGQDAYLNSGWNVMDFFLVVISVTDLLVTRFSDTKSSILGVLKVFRALRTLRPLRVISRAPGLKLVVETLLSSLKPIGNLLVIAGVFFTIFGILGVQLFKGSFYYCLNPTAPGETKAECLLRGGSWRNREYNFDNLLKAMLTLFVFSTKDGWVALMYHGIDAVGVDKQPIKNHNPWAFLYFFSFLLIAGFVVINMVVGVIIDNFHRCRIEIEAIDGIQKHFQTEEEHILDGIGGESGSSSEPNLLRSSNASLYKTDTEDKQETSSLSDDENSSINESLFDSFPLWRRVLYTIVTHYKFDIMIATVIGLNVFFMAIEYYKMPYGLMQFLKISNFIFTGVFILEAVMKMLAFGIRTFFSERWNQLDVVIVILSIIGIVLEELNESLPINPTIIRIMRVLRITRVLKILKSADGIQKLLNCLSEALPQVGNLSMLFMLLFFIFSSLGMELFGKLDCSRDICKGLNRHAHFENFGRAMLTLFRISTGDSWSGIMRDTLNPKICTQDCGMLYWVAPIYFAFFVLSTQFVLVNVVVAVLMKQLEDSKDGSLTVGSRSMSDMSDNFEDEHDDYQIEDNANFSMADEGKREAQNGEGDKKGVAEEKKPREGDYLQYDCEDFGTNLAFSPEYLERREILDRDEFSDEEHELPNMKCGSFERGIDNAVIMVSPAKSSRKSHSLSKMSLDTDGSTHEGNIHTRNKMIELPDTQNCGSMPEIPLRLPFDVDRTLSDASASMSCLDTIKQTDIITTQPKRRKSENDHAVYATRKRSSSKVAPQPEPSSTLTHNNEKQNAAEKLTVGTLSGETHASKPDNNSLVKESTL